MAMVVLVENLVWEPDVFEAFALGRLPDKRCLTFDIASCTELRVGMNWFELLPDERLAT